MIKEIANLRGLTWSTLDVSNHLTCINSMSFRLRHDEAMRVLFTVLDHDLGEDG